MLAAPAFAAIEHLMPKPFKVESTQEGFSTAGPVRLIDPTNSTWLRTTLGELGIEVSETAERTVEVQLVERVADGFDYEVPAYGNEGYELTVGSQTITIKAVEPVGVIRAAQTLSQLAMEGNGTIPGAEIADRPAFKVRGFMQDVGRSFLSVDELKREIDLLSRFKINTFHWHLTDYTGWRLEIKAYPQLTSDRAITRYPGCFYTQEQAKEIQDYAAERGMTVIPEIDMPGHAHPFEQAMGHNMQTSEGIAELKVILSEVAALFDKAPYIHIGGDEVSFNDQYIVDMINYVHSLGKKAVIWNRYNTPAKTVNPTSIPCDMTTNWATSGTLSRGVPNIDMRYNYTNHFDLFADVVGIFKSTIFYETQGNPDVAGTISAAWCDTKVPDENAIVRQNNIYANILASGERAWCGGGKQYIEVGGTTLPNSGAEYEEFADWERRFLYHKNTTMAAASSQIPYVKQTNVRWNITDQIPNGGNASAVFAPEDYIGKESVPEVFTIDNTDYHVGKATGAGIYLRHIWHGTVKGFYENPQNGMTAYAWTYVYSPKDQDAGALIEFYTYSRSGNEKGPKAGAWDRRGSKIYINGEEIAAPAWEQPDKNITQNHNTEGLTNENVTARPATAIRLKQGWNQVFMKLPHANNGGTGRDKWQFTFVITDTEGKDALDGLIYSPGKCIDEQAEQLSTLISDARARVRAYVSDTPGYKQSTALDVDLLAAAAEIEATLSQQLSAEERTAQATRLQGLLDAFNAGIDAVDIVKPANGSCYYLLTPLRGSRYVKDNNGTLTGITGTPGRNCGWFFELRNDGTYNLRNAATGRYVDNTAANNTPLTSNTTPPAQGWEIKPASTTRLVIITNGSAQFNQTNNAGQGFNIFNWGNGTNTTDTGCSYQLIDAPYVEQSGLTETLGDETVTIRGGIGCIKVTPAATKVEVLNLQGIKIAEGHGTIPVPQGVVIVIAGGCSQKVHVN